MKPAVTISEESELYIIEQMKLAISREIMFLDMLVQIDHEKLLFTQTAQT